MYHNKFRSSLIIFLFTLLAFNLSAQEITADDATDNEVTIEDVAAGNAAACDLITGKEAGFDYHREWNRALHTSIDVSAFAAVELKEQYTVKAGLSLGSTGSSFDIKTFVQGKIGPLFGVPLHFSLAYVYNGLPGYEAHSYTLLPTVSYSGKWAGIAIGPGFRFTRFFGASTIYEAMLSFSAYAYFLNREKLRLGISIANFSDFVVGNMGSYNPGINSLFRFNEKWSMINNLELLQSGSVGLAANFYGIAYRGGVKFTW